MNAAGKNKTVIFFFLLCVFLTGTLHNSYGQSYGLTFSSHESDPEKRTSLNLTGLGPICFTSTLDLSFELGFGSDYNVSFGYIFRLININDQNIDFIYDQQKLKFRMVAGETFTDIDIEIDENTLKREWSKLRVSINSAGLISCYYNNKVWKSKIPELKNKCFRLIFGASDEHNFISRDLPPMNLRNINVSTDGKPQHFWPLNESAGTVAADNISHKSGKITNPVWINPKHSNWEHLKGFTVSGRPSIAFDPVKEIIYIVGEDSIYTLAAINGKLTALPLSTPHSNLLKGNQSAFNPYNGRLYNFYADQQIVASYDTASRRWDRNFKEDAPTNFWQLNKFITKNGSLFLIGGYGQLKYKNTVQKYDFSTGSWNILKPAGDMLAPRYLSAAGVTESTDTAYIIGGYGSKEGDQLLRPTYFYDLLRYDVGTNRFKKIYSLPEPKEQFVFANSLLIDNATQSYYALIFPNSRFNSKLQLIRGSLSKPTYSLLGNPFPYSFNDVKSYADFYHCKKKKALLAATFYTNKEDITAIDIYTINFPVNEFAVNNPAVTGAVPDKRISLTTILASIVVCVLTAALLYFFYRRRNLVAASKNSAATLPPQLSKNADINIPSAPQSTSPVSPKSKILLFCDFEAVTADGTNITRHFSPLLKEMFLLILIDSLRYNKGVSSEKLNDILWNNKDIKDAQNNRSVNLVKLKNILDKLEGCTISRETDVWKFQHDPQKVYIDFAEYLDLFTQNYPADLPGSIDRLLLIIKDGSFLQKTDYDWLDRIKSEISDFVIEKLRAGAEHLEIHKDAEKMITISNAIFNFEELNEYALKLKCKALVSLGKHTLAKSTFDKFSAKYQLMYGDNFQENYLTVIGK